MKGGDDDEGWNVYRFEGRNYDNQTLSNFIKQIGGDERAFALNMDSVCMNQGFFNQLSEMLGKHQSLTILRLPNFKVFSNEGEQIDPEKLFQELYSNNQLQLLNFSGSDLGGASINRISELFSLNSLSCLNSLILHGNDLGDVGVKSLVSYMSNNNSLESLSLESNGIGDIGAEAIGRCLLRNEALKELFLSDNEIGNAGAESLAAGLLNNSSLSRLSIYSNNIGDLGAAHFALALNNNENSSLVHLSLYYNYIGVQGSQALQAAWRGRPQEKLKLEWQGCAQEIFGENNTPHIQEILEPFGSLSISPEGDIDMVDMSGMSGLQDQF